MRLRVREHFSLGASGSSRGRPTDRAPAASGN